jgi:CheY-like chemotaxis protein
MMTNATTDGLCHSDPRPAMPVQRVVIVNGSAEVLELFDTMLEAGHYSVVFVESNEHAYSQIRRVLPNLVILCVRIDQAESLQVLSMLKLDPLTRDIPTLTFAAEREAQMSDDDLIERAEAEMFAPKPAVRMN